MLAINTFNISKTKKDFIMTNNICVANTICIKLCVVCTF